jgi:hypothetical protein
MNRAVRVEDLGHADFAADDSCNHEKLQGLEARGSGLAVADG